jgi:hypothetical protein
LRRAPAKANHYREDCGDSHSGSPWRKCTSKAERKSLANRMPSCRWGVPTEERPLARATAQPQFRQQLDPKWQSCSPRGPMFFGKSGSTG